MQFAQQDDPVPRTALPADVSAFAILIVEPKSIPAAAEWARPVLVGKKPGLNAELWQNLAPAVTSALYSAAHHATRCLAWDLAHAMLRERIQEAVATDGGRGGRLFHAHGGNAPVFSLNLCAAHPGLCPRCSA